jgi:toxin ParE1/3/4
MVRLIWTEKALNDLEEIKNYITRDSSYYAENVVTKIREKINSLKKFPEKGRIIPEIEDNNYREIFLWRYRLMYRIIEGDIYILAVFHGARNFKLEIIETK